MSRRMVIARLGGTVLKIEKGSGAEMGAWAAPVAVLGMLSSVDTTDSPFEAERENYTGSIAEVVATDIGTDNSGSMVVGVRYMDMGHFVSDDR